jgi:hypothetical protein
MNKNKQTAKKDRCYIPVLDRPVEELKREAEIPVDFSALVSKAVNFDRKKRMKN